MKGYKFVAVEFTDDPNVVGNLYWYFCEFDNADIGTRVVAPIGRHNKLQVAVVRRVMFAEEAYSPYPFSSIKKIDGVLTEKP
ncbi:MAG: hypothetical protein IJU84_00535 [Clostridia bacterium]|nr:hypothetical protein [Clostridia bacterium]MBQ9480631.1 hypothetical protein [Clostridia bacterium]